jgi:hypothetical protein
MALYEMYEPLPDGRRRLVSTFDSETDAISMVNDAQPVVMQRATLRTSQQPKPRPPLAAKAEQRPLTLMQYLTKHGRCPQCAYVLADCHCAPGAVQALQAVQ